jgi:3-oxoacyl-[acyl-carrier protein] reductase
MKTTETPAPGLRVALVTGGTRGIGRAIVVELTRRGWAVATCFLKNEELAAALESELKSTGSRLLVIRADVSDPVVAANLVRRVEAEYGRIDALINCVGAYHRTSLIQESIEGWHAMFDGNLHPVFYLSRAAVPGMMERRWGRIVNFGLVNADQMVGQPFVTAHYISKVGVIVLTRSLARSLAPYGITANTISPGFIDTGLVPRKEIAGIVPSIPAGYVGSPQDAVSAVCYLLSDEARYVNGTNIHLSGGWGI